MTQREKRYHFRKSKIGKMMAEVRRKVFMTMVDTGMAGSFVGLDEKGDVVARVLSTEELLELDPNNLPEGYSVYK